MSGFTELFFLGVASSYGPCVAFCAPAILAYIASTKKGWKEGLFAAVAFSVARLMGHAFLGALAGFAGVFLARVINFGGFYIYIAGGIFISISGLMILSGKNISKKCCKNSSGKANFVGSGKMTPVVMGLIAGVMPCLPLMSAVGYIAVSAQSGYQGLLLGTAFGIGTLFSPVIPLGVMSAVFPEKILKGRVLYSVMTKVCGILLIAIGINLIFGKTLF